MIHTNINAREKFRPDVARSNWINRTFGGFAASF
jgi:hypothetical protein